MMHLPRLSVRHHTLVLAGIACLSIVLQIFSLRSSSWTVVTIKQDSVDLDRHVVFGIFFYFESDFQHSTNTRQRAARYDIFGVDSPSDLLVYPEIKQTSVAVLVCFVFAFALELMAIFLFFLVENRKFSMYSVLVLALSLMTVATGLAWSLHLALRPGSDLYADAVEQISPGEAHVVQTVSTGWILCFIAFTVALGSVAYAVQKRSVFAASAAEQYQSSLAIGRLSRAGSTFRSEYQSIP